jgi:predicted permease
MQSILGDVRYACRSLMGNPGWTLAAVLCLAIGIGPNTAAFGIANGLLLRPLPFDQPDELVMVAVQEADRTRPFSWAEYLEVAPGIAPISELLVRTFAPVALAADDGSRMVEGELVSANYFALLRLEPVAGRFLRADADRPGMPAEAVISHALWQRRFNADPAIVGRVMRVNSHPVTICGVAPPGFVGVTSIVAVDLWMPAALGATVAGTVETVPQFGAAGRLKAGATKERLRAGLDVVLAGRARAGERPLTSVVVRGSGFGVPPAVRSVVLGVSALLFGLITLVTGVAIANVASLTLARATDRRREIAVRMALGASPRHIVRQMLVESLLLALAGATIGYLLAGWVTRGFAALAPSTGQPAHIAMAIDVAPDLRVLIYAMLAAIVVAALFGLAPARYASRTDVVDALKSAGGGGRRPGTVRALRAIVIGQLAVSTTLLVGAGLLVRSYLNTLAVAPGIETRGLVAVSLDVDQLGIDASHGRRVYDEIVRRLSTLPGVEGVSLVRERPLNFAGRTAPVWVDHGPQASAEPRDAGAVVVTPEYFGLAGIAVVQGRLFAAGDGEGQAPVAIVNETMARRFWRDESPLGRTFRVRSAGAPVVIVGVARDVPYRSPTEEPRAVFYRPFAQEYAAGMNVLIRRRPGAASMASGIEREIRAVNPDLAIVDVSTLDDQVRTARAPRRQSAVLLLSVCGLGLLLSSVGLYGVVAYGVRRRAREFGIRIALGAAARDVRLMVLAQGFRLALAGLGLGFALSLVLTRAIARMLYGVTTYDPLTLITAAGVLALVTLSALYMPARWATRVDPMITLREE